MKCFNHPNADAAAVCIHCGRALCPSCVNKSDSGRIVCSPACSAALLQAEQSLQSLRSKTVASMRLMGWLMLAGAVVFGGFGLWEFFKGIEKMGLFLLPLAVVFGVTGVVCLQIARRQDAG